MYRNREFWEACFRNLGLWPEMMKYDVVSQEHSRGIDEHFLNFQLLAVLKSDLQRVIGVAHSVPLFVGDDIAKLPETGWDWALNKAMSDRVIGLRPNAVCGLSITVFPEFQRCGVGRSLINAVLRLAFAFGLRNVVMPVRPISRVRLRSLSIDEFLDWRREDGLHHDPWIRTHELMGGRVLNACHRSMRFVAPLADWEQWCKRRFTKSGLYDCDECLTPIVIDVDRAVGCYEEPNIWVVHDCF